MIAELALRDLAITMEGVVLIKIWIELTKQRRLPQIPCKPQSCLRERGRTGKVLSQFTPPPKLQHCPREPLSEEDDWDVYCGGSREAPFASPPAEFHSVFGVPEQERNTIHTRYRPGATRSSRDLPAVGVASSQQTRRFMSPIPPSTAIARAREAGPVNLRGHVTSSGQPSNGSTMKVKIFWVVLCGISLFLLGGVYKLLRREEVSFHVYAATEPPLLLPSSESEESLSPATIEILPLPYVRENLTTNIPSTPTNSHTNSSLLQKPTSPSSNETVPVLTIKFSAPQTMFGGDAAVSADLKIIVGKAKEINPWISFGVFTFLVYGFWCGRCMRRWVKGDPLSKLLLSNRRVDESCSSESEGWDLINSPEAAAGQDLGDTDNSDEDEWSSQVGGGGGKGRGGYYQSGKVPVYLNSAKQVCAWPPPHLSSYHAPGHLVHQNDRWFWINQQEYLSFSLSHTLRHDAKRMGLSIDEEGWVCLDDLLNHPRFHVYQYTVAQLKQCAAQQSKSRLLFKGNYVAAQVGHSIRGVNGPGEMLSTQQVPQTLSHGTYNRHLDSIRAKGILSSGSEGHRASHFSDGETLLRAGYWRKDLECAVDIAAQRAAEDGYTFTRAANGVYCCMHTLPPEYILGTRKIDHYHQTSIPSYAAASLSALDRGASGSAILAQEKPPRTIRAEELGVLSLGSTDARRCKCEGKPSFRFSGENLVCTSCGLISSQPLCQCEYQARTDSTGPGKGIPDINPRGKCERCGFYRFIIKTPPRVPPNPPPPPSKARAPTRGVPEPAQGPIYRKGDHPGIATPPVKKASASPLQNEKAESDFPPLSVHGKLSNVPGHPPKGKGKSTQKPSAPSDTTVAVKSPPVSTPPAEVPSGSLGKAGRTEPDTSPLKSAKTATVPAQEKQAAPSDDYIGVTVSAPSSQTETRKAQGSIASSGVVPPKAVSFALKEDTSQWLEDVPPLSDESPVFNPGLSFQDLEAWIANQWNKYQKGRAEEFLPPHLPGSAQVPDVTPQIITPEGVPENFGLPDPASLLLPSGAPTSVVSASDSGGYLRRGSGAKGSKTTTSEAETQARLAPIDFIVKHTENTTVTAVEITRALLQEAGRHDMCLATCVLNEFCEWHGAGKKYPKGAWVIRPWNRFEANYHKLALTMNLYPIRAAVVPGDAELWKLPPEFDDRLEKVREVFRLHGIPVYTSGELYSTYDNNAATASDPWHFSASWENKERQSRHYYHLVCSMMGEGHGLPSILYPSGAYRRHRLIRAQIDQPSPATVSRPGIISPFANCHLFRDPILLITEETAKYGTALASEVGLFRLPAVGDFFITRNWNDEHPEWCTKVYDDWSPKGARGEALLHGTEYGPVVEVRIITYPSTEAAALCTMADNQVIPGHRYRGRGIAVAIKHPKNPDALGFINLTSDNYRTPTRFGTLTGAASAQARYTSGYLSVYENNHVTENQDHAKGKFGPARSPPDTRPNKLDRPPIDLTASVMSSNLLSFEFSEGEDLGFTPAHDAETALALGEPLSEGTPSEWRMTYVEEGSLIYDAYMRDGCALKLLNGALVHLLTFEEVREKLEERPLTIVFQSTYYTDQCRSTALAQGLDPVTKVMIESTHPSPLDYSMLEICVWIARKGLEKYVDLKNLTPDDDDSLTLPLIGMQALDPLYDQSAGGTIPESQQLDFYHGSSHEGVVAIILSKALSRGKRELESKHGVFVGKEHSALTYAPPQALLEGTDRKWSLIFNVKAVRLYHSDQNRSYWMARENWVQLESLKFVYFGMGIPKYNSEYFTTIPDGPLKPRPFDPETVPKNWNAWVPDHTNQKRTQEEPFKSDDPGESLLMYPSKKYDGIYQGITSRIAGWGVALRVVIFDNFVLARDTDMDNLGTIPFCKGYLWLDSSTRSDVQYGDIFHNLDIAEFSSDGPVMTIECPFLEWQPTPPGRGASKDTIGVAGSASHGVVEAIMPKQLPLSEEMLLDDVQGRRLAAPMTRERAEEICNEFTRALDHPIGSPESGVWLWQGGCWRWVHRTDLYMDAQWYIDCELYEGASRGKSYQQARKRLRAAQHAASKGTAYRHTLHIDPTTDTRQLAYVSKRAWFREHRRNRPASSDEIHQVWTSSLPENRPSLDRPDTQEEIRQEGRSSASGSCDRQYKHHVTPQWPSWSNWALLIIPLSAIFLLLVVCGDVVPRAASAPVTSSSFSLQRNHGKLTHSKTLVTQPTIYYDDSSDADEGMEGYLRALKTNHGYSRQVQNRRMGGPRRSTKVNFLGASDPAVKPKLSRLYNEEYRSNPIQTLPLGLPNSSYREQRTALVLDKIALSSQRIYDNQLQWWKLFCKARKIDPIWRTNAPDLSKEDTILDFIIHSGVVLGKAPGTVKLRLGAIRNHHLALGLPDPLVHMPRVPMALAGLKRRYGTKERRKPVTTRMLAWIKSRISIETSSDAALLWAAVTIGFFFLLRASEYLDVGRPTPGRGLLGRHVVLKHQGQPCNPSDFKKADEVSLTIQGSKTDIYNKGESRNHFKTLDCSWDENLCVVEAVVALAKHFPNKFFGQPGSHEPLLMDNEGIHLDRSTMQRLLQRADAATGGSGDQLGSHSLRFGGASALWAAYHDSGLVKRWGRWASDSFHTYLWEERKGSRGIATAMANCDVTPT